MNLNPPHIHLLLNHGPVIGSIAAALLLLWALLRKTAEAKRLALGAVLLVGLVTVPAYLTGEPAAHAVGHEPGIERRRIHEHEEAGEWGLIGASIAGVIALGGLVAFRRREPPMLFIALTLLVNLWTVAIFTRVALLGGEIRHPEIREGWTPAPRPAGESPPDREP